MAKRRTGGLSDLRKVLLAVAFGWCMSGARHGLHAQEASLVGCGSDLECLQQGWTDADRAWWYTISQGSRLLPLDWIKALQQAGSEERFLHDTNLARFNYLPNPTSMANPHGLPVGFAVDQQGGARAEVMCDVFPASCESGSMREPWIGMNCSACHTGQLRHKGKTIRIDGAPTLADFQTFMEELLASLKATKDDPIRFDRFARAVLGEHLSVERRLGLATELGEQIAWLGRVEAKNAAPIRYGYGRLDAQGHILNKISLVVGAAAPLPGFSADAPASYPHIWNASQHRKLQWNGIVSNLPRMLRLELIAGKETDLGALVRNTGEVLGVFAQIDVDSKSRTHYRSSVQVGNLIDIERRLARLESPRWPENLLGKIDWDHAALGKPLFEQHCQGCHKPLDARELKLPANEQMFDLAKSGTDIALACNAFLHRSEAGVLERRPQFMFIGDPIEKQDFTRTILTNIIIGTILGRADELARKAFEDIFFRGGDLRASVTDASKIYLPGVADATKRARAETCMTTAAEILAYKARPLNGIWATAPYLHNGSVPTLYDLLLPPRLRNVVPKLNADSYLEELARPPSPGVRPESFTLGSREFDAVKVGFETKTNTDGKLFIFRVLDNGSKPIFGNFNSGHEYATHISDEERRALVEYMKTL